MNWRLHRRAGGLAWRQAGDRHGPAVVLLHGFFQDSRAWSALLRRLPAHEVQERHWIAIDLPGHGASAGVALTPLGQGAWPALAVLLDDALDAALGQRPGPVTVVGYSFGGRAAAWWLGCAAAASAVGAASAGRGLAGRGVAAALLESAHPGLTRPQQAERCAQDHARAALIAEQGLGVFADRWAELELFASQRSLPAALRRAQQRLRLAQKPAGLMDHLRSLGTGTMPRLDGPAPPWPVTLLAGALDPTYATLARQWQQAWPEAQVTIAAQAGHNVHLEQPLQWWHALQALPRAVAGRPPAPL